MNNTNQRGTVKVVNGRYRPSGHFHYIYPNSPIYDESGKLMGITNPRDITHIHAYGGESLFFESLKDGILWGTRCDNPDCEHTGTVNIPFKTFCPDCLKKMTPVDLTNVAYESAVVHTFMVTERTGAFNTLEKPIRFINIEFDGVQTILMSYLSVGEPEIGMRVVPIFRMENPTFTILDLSWVPIGTSEDKLPTGYSFSK
ncbi:MAG: Zn-ribbon domain-containing OB-fold protein [Fidelibacterota bacterium]